MAYQYLDNMELELAIEQFTKKLDSITGLKIKQIPVVEAYGRVTSDAVYAKISSPHYNSSAMDGIALKASVTFGASDTTPVLLEEGADFICVDTGDAIPEDCDAVVMIEDVIEVGNNKINKENDTKINSKRIIKLISAASPWQNIRQIGEDLCETDMIIPSNTIIEAASIGAIMAGGVLNVNVWAKHLVGIIPTGDEIVPPTSNPKKGEIIEFNSSIFSALLKQIGTEVKVYPIVPDDKAKISSAVLLAAKECDLVLLNAGSSAGREDYSKVVLEELGEVFVHGIAIKPGKPTILAIVNNHPVIGVPGYPVSGIIVMEKIVKGILLNMMNRGNPLPQQIKAFLTRNVVSSLKYKEFVRVKLGCVGGRIVATPLNRGAAVVTSFVKADGIMEIPINSEGFLGGQEIMVETFKTEETIKNTLVAIGSHDPMIDMISDMFRHQKSKYNLSSSHVGSMGGIMAIKRKETHIAGIHLLDEKTGVYNFSYIEKYLEKGKTALIHGLSRQQGLMVAPGNPKKITSLKDLFSSIRYVNRQRGSGTRILFDFLLDQNELEGKKIDGYDREEFTHMNIAAIIASGNADAGLGIYSVANAFGLDFIPICEEKYDLIAPVEYLEDPMLVDLIKILNSEEFKKKIIEMGGYLIDSRIGEVTIV